VTLAAMARNLITNVPDTPAALWDSAKQKLLNAMPAALLDTIDQISASRRDLENPQTVDQWGRAIQRDAIAGMMKESYVGTLGTAPNRGAKMVSGIYSKSDAIVGDGTPSKSRIEQFFGILDRMVSDVTGSPTGPPKQPQEALSSGGFRLAALWAEPQDDLVARQLREKMFHSMLAGLVEAGMYDQAVELHRLAVARWGDVQDPEVAKSVKEYLHHATVILDRILVTHLSIPEGSDRSKVEEADVRHGGSTAIVYRLKTSPEHPLWFPSLQVDLGGKDTAWPDGFRFTVSVTHGPKGAARLIVNRFSFPIEVMQTESGGGWNTLRIRYVRGDFNTNWLQFYLNGQLIFQGDVPTGLTRDSSGNAVLRAEPKKYPLSIRIVGGRGETASVRIVNQALPPNYKSSYDDVSIPFIPAP
jgi:hypothetical protein